MAIKKKELGLDSIKSKFSTSAKYKPQRYFDLGTEFLDAVGIPGPAIGHINMFLGHSDTGKTTALVKAAVDAQKKGILPVFINGNSKDNWQWSAIKTRELTEEEAESLSNKGVKYKSDTSTMKFFEGEFIEALDYIGFFDKE